MKKSFFKCFLFFHLLSFVFFSDLKAQWQRTNGPRQDEVLCFAAKDSFTYMGTNSSGFYRSSDKGKHWIQKGDTLFRFYEHFRITACIATDSGVLVGTAKNGIYKSLNQGDSWSRVVNGLPINLSDPPDTIYPWVNDLIYSGTNIISETSWGMFYSSDYGQTWLPSNGIPPTTLIIKITKKDSSIYAPSGNKIYKSVDDGVTWSYTGVQLGSLIHRITSNDSIIIAIADLNQIYISFDNGLSYQFTSTTIPINAMIECLLGKGSEIFIGTDRYGIYYSPDNGISWTTLNNGFSQSGTSALFMHDSDIYAGNYYGVFYSSNNGAYWECRNDGIDKYEELDKIMTQGQNIYGLRYGMFHSSDMGTTWSPINNGLPINSKGAWLSDFNLIGTTLISGIQNFGVYFSSDSGITWQNKNIGLPCPGAQKIAINGSDIIIANDTCGLFISHDTGSTWISIQNGLPAYNYSREIAATDSVIYCAFDNSLILYESRNKGLNWTPINQPSLIWQIKTSDETVMLILTDQVKISKDHGHTWNTFITGLPYNTQFGYFDLYSGATNGVDYFIGSQGFGIFKLENHVWVPVSWGLPIPPISINSPIDDLAFQDSLLIAAVGDKGVWKRNIDSIKIQTYTGNIFSDLNNNGIKDNGEAGLANIIANTKVSNSFYNTDSTGDYMAFADCDYDTIVAITGSLYASISPAYYSVAQSDSGKDFAVHFIPDVKDLRITLTDMTPARPGFNDQLRITYKNKGTVALNGTVKLIMDNVCSYLYSLPTHDSIMADTIAWNFSNLLPLETRNITTVLNIPSNTPLWTDLNFSAHIFPVITDTVPSDNSDSLAQQVSGSYDPNEKEVNPTAISPLQVINGKYLYYTIHFQNTGNDTAFTVRILDTLDQNLQVQTFEVLSASHPYTYTINGMGIVEFTFNAIYLPDSNISEMNSHGFIKYKIQPKKSLVTGTVIYNTANIFFDFNAPIITNTTSTPVILNVFVYEINNHSSHIIIYPNPSTDFVNIKYDSEESVLIKIYNLNGQLVYEKQLTMDGLTKIELSKFSKGLYVINILGNTIFQTGKLVIE